MNRTEIARTVMEAAARGDAATAKSHLSNDFVLTGPTPEPLNAEQWLGLHQLINVGMPDFSFNISDVQEKGDTVTLTMQITGTHQGTLDLSPMGLPVIPATGIRVKLPVEKPQITFRGDKIIGAHLDIPPGGGVIGLLSQLGVQM